MCEIITNVFSLLNNAKIQFVVLRKYELLPERSIDEDIDILVSCDDIYRTKYLLKKQGFLVFQDIYPHIFAILYDIESSKFIKFDIIDELVYGKVLAIPFPKNYKKIVLRRRIPYKSFFIPSLEDEFILTFLHCIGNKGTFKTYYRRKLAKISNSALDSNYLNYTLIEIFSELEIKNIIKCMSICDFKSLSIYRIKLTKFLVSKLNLNKIKNTYEILKARVKRKVLGRKGLVIALLGTDGSGKTSIAIRLCNIKILNPTYVYMGRDQFIIPTRKIINRIKEFNRRGYIESSVVNKEIEDSGGVSDGFKIRDIIDVFRLIHDLADYYLRYYYNIYFPYRRGALVISDRYIYDLFLGKEKIQQQKFFNEFTRKFFPEPDYVFVLEAPPAVMLSRKGEHNITFLKSKQVDILKLGKTFDESYRIKTNIRIEKSIDNIVSIIWRKYFKKLYMN